VAEVRFQPRAEHDLDEIWRAIAEGSPRAADAFITRIFSKLDLAAEHPLMGAARPELSPTARILIEGRYVIIYEPQPDGVLAVAIVHGMRDPEGWLTSLS